MACLSKGALVALTCLLSGGCAGDDGPTSALVVRVIDGDTVELDGGERLRYLMIDAPEDTSEVECYGPEATAYNQTLVEGKDIEMTFDAERTDRFGRLLAFVTVGGREVNTLMVERGYACVLHIPPNGNDREDEFETLQAVAKSQNRGLWGACEELPCN